jgi:hypothetical protein
VSCASFSFCVAVDEIGNALTYTGVAPPSNNAPPTISGTAQQGQTLTEVHGSWSNSPTSYSYQWEDCDSSGSNCTPIAGATNQTYSLTSADVGHTIRVSESATNAGGTGAAAPSGPTAVVQALAVAPSNTSPPTISGSASVGQTLTCSPGSWSGSPAPTFSYQWQRDGADIAGASGSTYVVQAADQGHTLTCKVTASNSAGQASAVSTGVAIPAGGGSLALHVAASLPVVHNSIHVGLTCTGTATCEGTLTLAAKGAAKNKRARVSKVTTIGKAKFSIAGGKSATIKVKVNAAGRALLKAHHGKLTATLTITKSSPSPASMAHKTVHLVQKGGTR